MSEIYKQKEWELRSKIENIDTISSNFEDYVEEVDRFVGYLLNDTKEINVLRSENKRLHSIIKEVRELAEKYELGKYDYSIPVFELKEILAKANESEKK